MPIRMQKDSIEFMRLALDEELIAREAEQVLGHSGMCTVLKHHAVVSVRYLIELPNGERKWISGRDSTAVG